MLFGCSADGCLRGGLSLGVGWDFVWEWDGWVGEWWKVDGMSGVFWIFGCCLGVGWDCSAKRKSAFPTKGTSKARGESSKM